MKCEEIKKWLVDYVLEEFKKPELKDVRMHLQECDKCSEEAKEILNTFKVMGRFKEIDVPDDMCSKLRQEMRNLDKPQPYRYFNFLRRPVPVYGVISIVLSFCILVSLPKVFKKVEEPNREIKVNSFEMKMDTSSFFTPSPSVSTASFTLN